MRDLRNVDHFWFVAQTGVLHDSPPSGSFHAYMVEEGYRAEVEAIFERTTLGESGLIYQAKDLARLEQLDRAR